jgi:hypothetical protein
VRLRVAGLTGPSGGSTRGIFYEDPSLGRPWPSIACGLRAILVNALSLLRLVDVYHVGAVTKRLHVENLLEISVPVSPLKEQARVIRAYAEVLRRSEEAKNEIDRTAARVDATVLRTRAS